MPQNAFMLHLPTITFIKSIQCQNTILSNCEAHNPVTRITSTELRDKNLTKCHNIAQQSTDATTGCIRHKHILPLRYNDTHFVLGKQTCLVHYRSNVNERMSVKIIHDM